MSSCVSVNSLTHPSFHICHELESYGGAVGVCVMLRERVNLMRKCRLSRIYPFGEEKKDLFTCFVGLSPKPHLSPLPKSFWHLHLVHSGQALFAVLEKVVGAQPSPLRGTSVGLCPGKRGDFSFLLSPPLPHNYNMVIVCQWIMWPLGQHGLLLRLWLWTSPFSSAWKDFNPCKYKTRSTAWQRRRESEREEWRGGSAI